MDISSLIDILQKQDIDKNDLINLLNKVKMLDGTRSTQCSTTPVQPRAISPSLFYPKETLSSNKMHIFNESDSQQNKKFLSKPNSPINKQKNQKPMNQFEKLYRDAQLMQEKRASALNKKSMEETEKRKSMTFKPLINKTNVCSSLNKRRSSLDQKIVGRKREDSTKGNTQYNSKLEQTKHVTIDLHKSTNTMSSSYNNQFILRQKIYAEKKKKHIADMTEEISISQSASRFEYKSIDVPKGSSKSKMVDLKGKSKAKTPLKEYLNLKGIQPYCKTPAPHMADEAYKKLGFYLEKVDITNNEKKWDTLKKAQQAIKELQTMSKANSHASH